MRYYGIMPKRKLWVKVAVILFAVYTIYSSITNHNLFYLPFGVVMIVATFSKRKHIVSDDGVDILYTICKMEFHNMWSWNDITTLHTKLISSTSNIELHIGKGVISRRFILPSQDVENILKFAKKVNSKIYIGEVKKIKTA